MRLPTIRRTARTASVLTALVLAVAACAGAAQPVATAPAPAAAPAPTVLATPSLRPGDPVPDPGDETVLTLTGRIGAHNAEGSLRLGPETLDRVGLVAVTVHEPWVKQLLDFQGVWLADLLAVARAEPAARTLHLTALDDYQIDLDAADVRAGGVLLATRTGDGAPIPVENGGPTRIVFTGGNQAGASADQWIWSLRTIDVR